MGYKDRERGSSKKGDHAIRAKPTNLGGRPEKGEQK